MDLETLKNICASNELDFQIIEDQVKVELLWNSLIFQLYKTKITINPEEIEEQLKLMEKQKKSQEYLISEILIRSVEDNLIENEIENLKNNINLEGFENIARTLSISESATLFFFNHLKTVLVLIFVKSIFRHKFSGTILIKLFNNPPPVIFAQPLISFFLLILLSSLT